MNDIAPRSTFFKRFLIALMGLGVALGIIAAIVSAYQAYNPKKWNEILAFVIMAPGIGFYLAYDFWDKLIDWGFFRGR